jgi:hypothetical protein
MHARVCAHVWLHKYVWVCTYLCKWECIHVCVHVYRWLKKREIFQGIWLGAIVGSGSVSVSLFSFLSILPWSLKSQGRLAGKEEGWKAGWARAAWNPQIGAGVHRVSSPQVGSYPSDLEGTVVLQKWGLYSVTKHTHGLEVRLPGEAYRRQTGKDSLLSQRLSVSWASKYTAMFVNYKTTATSLCPQTSR